MVAVMTPSPTLTLRLFLLDLDGETLANDGDDTFTGNGNLLINTELVVA